MPTSDYHTISDVLHVIEQYHPKRILDVGVGFGRWGVLLREVLEIYGERLNSEEWVTVIEGMEIFEGYRNPLWEFAYNKVYVGDAFEQLDRTGRYDLIIAGDVIEHFDKDKGKVFLEKMLDHADLVLVTSPRGQFPQSNLFGNEHERHLSEWSIQDFAPFPHLYKDIGATFLAVLSKDKVHLHGIELRQPLEVLGVKKGVLELAKLTWRQAKYRFKEGLSLLNNGS